MANSNSFKALMTLPTDVTFSGYADEMPSGLIRQ